MSAFPYWAVSDLADPTAQENKILTGAGIVQGQQGDTVALLQQQLKAWGFDPGAADGQYGPNTASAVSALQRKLGLSPNGNFDEQTQESVLADLSSSTSVIRQNQSVTRISTTTPSASSSSSSTSSATATSFFASPWFWGGLAVLAAGGAFMWWRHRTYTHVPAREVEPPALPEHYLRAPKRARKPSSRRSKRAA